MISTMKHCNSLKTNSLFDYHAQIIAQLVLVMMELHCGITIITNWLIQHQLYVHDQKWVSFFLIPAKF